MDPENSEDSGSDVIPEEEEEETHEIGGLINSDGEVDFPDLSKQMNWNRVKDRKKSRTHKKIKPHLCCYVI